MNPFDDDGWFTSHNSQYNPEMYPPPNYPIQFSSPSFDSATYDDSSSMQHNATDGQGDEDGNNDIEEQNRARRLAWTEEENIRLNSAWLNNSIDSVDGNNKKGEFYWKDVAADYNNNSPSDRRRSGKNCKDHWQLMNRKVVAFHGVYCRLRNAYASGQSDLQLVQKALAMYKKETNQNFTLMYWWDKVKVHHKWSRQVEEGKGKEDGTAQDHTTKEKRPMGQKAAKAKRKGKTDDDYPTLCHDDIQLYHDTQALKASSQEKMADVKLELSRRKERMKMSDTYKELLMADTSRMDDFQKMEHRRALKYFSDSLFGESDTSD